LTCAAHVNGRAPRRKSRVADFVKPHKAGRLVNQVKLAEDIAPLPRVERSPILPTIFCWPGRSGQGRYLVTGDKSRLLSLGRHHATRIVSAREFANCSMNPYRPLIVAPHHRRLLSAKVGTAPQNSPCNVS
jgi:hypothetical protein